MRLIILIGAMLAALVGGIAGCAPVAADSRTISVSADGSLPSGQLSGILPLGLSFDDSMGIAQVADLAHPLNVDASHPVTAYAAGDVLYWQSAQRIVIPISNGNALPDGGLVLLGHIASGLDYLIECTHSCSTTLVARQAAEHR